jgi:hypothetical protein
MKLFGRSYDSFKGDETGLIHEYIACRINAMIEVLDLPVELLAEADPDCIMQKLLELSDDKEHWQTPEDQLTWLDNVAGRICENEEMIEEVIRLTRNKFEAYASVPVAV